MHKVFSKLSQCDYFVCWCMLAMSSTKILLGRSVLHAHVWFPTWTVLNSYRVSISETMVCVLYNCKIIIDSIKMVWLSVSLCMSGHSCELLCAADVHLCYCKRHYNEALIALRQYNCGWAMVSYEPWILLYIHIVKCRQSTPHSCLLQLRGGEWIHGTA